MVKSAAKQARLLWPGWCFDWI